MAAFLWRRLDEPGHDSCRLFKTSNGWRLAGSAVFSEAKRICHFDYSVVADTGFRSKRAEVVGYLGNRAIDLEIRSAGAGRWRIDGTAVAAASGCLDIDLGFTPATNLLAIRRLGLRIGDHADAPAAYLNLPHMKLTKLPQRYERVARNEYAYESPTAGYSAMLRVSALGAVIDYPGVFELIDPR